jgi:hypothetical protein
MSVINGAISHFFHLCLGLTLAVPAHSAGPFSNGDQVTHPHNAEFQFAPQPTVFVVNVIHAHPGKQEEAFKIIQDVVHYVAERKQGFLWSNLSKSTDGKTVVNIEAIRDENNVGEFFSDPVFVEKFKMLDTVSTSEFHIYKVSDLVLPSQLTQ